MDWREVVERDLGVFEEQLPALFSDPSSSLVPANRLKDGYPLERFVVPPSPDFICAICLCVVRNPMECPSCGVLICEKCVETYKSVRRQQRRVTHCNLFACPTCRESAPPVLPSKVLISILQESEIHCKHFSQGCQFTTSLGQIHLHEKVCIYKVTKCAYCGVIGTKETFNRLERGWSCSEACERTLKFKEAVMNKHHEDAVRQYYELLADVREVRLPSTS